MTIFSFRTWAMFGIAGMVSLFPMVTSAQDLSAATSIEENLSNVAKVWCGYYDEFGDPEISVSGSSVVLDDNLLITNAHVVFYLDEFDPEGTFYFYDFCWGGVSENNFTEPLPQFNLEYTTYNWNSEFDYAYMEAFDEFGNPWSFDSEVTYGNPDSLIHGDDITLIGYPAVAGATITSTFGAVAGFDSETWIKTDAVAEFGSSGGGAFDGLGNFIGIPTIVNAGELNSFTLIQNINAIVEDSFPEGTIIRDLSNLYSEDNVTCFENGDCFNLGEGENIDLNEDEVLVPGDAEVFNGDDPETPTTSLGSSIEKGKFESDKLDNNLIERLTGFILLQVDNHGEAWYVNPDDKLRYYLRDGEVAYRALESFGLGIINSDLESIPLVNSTDDMLSKKSICSENSLANRLKGNILLQVEEHGEAYWIHPEKCYRIYLEDGNAAYEIMRFLSMGISSDDLAKMPTGDIK